MSEPTELEQAIAFQKQLIAELKVCNEDNQALADLAVELDNELDKCRKDKTNE